MALTKEKTELLSASFHRSEMLSFFQASILAMDKGYFSIKIPKAPFMTRKAGMFNGAVIASLVDASSGYAAVSAKEKDAYLVTVELKVNYLNPAIGDALVSRSYVLKAGSKIAVVRTEIFCTDNESEQHVATSLVTLMYIK